VSSFASERSRLQRHTVQSFSIQQDFGLQADIPIVPGAARPPDFLFTTIGGLYRAVTSNYIRFAPSLVSYAFLLRTLSKGIRRKRRTRISHGPREKTIGKVMTSTPRTKKKKKKDGPNLYNAKKCVDPISQTPKRHPMNVIDSQDCGCIRIQR